MKKLILFLGLLLLGAHLAQAAPCAGEEDPRCFIPEVRWKIQNNRIIDACYNYENYSPQKRKCVMQARMLMRQRCKDYLELASRTTRGELERNLRMVDRFCSSEQP